MEGMKKIMEVQGADGIKHPLYGDDFAAAAIADILARLNELEAKAVAAWNARKEDKDAARYRWLRGGADVPQHSTRWPRWEVRNWSGRWWETIFAEKMDAEIDAAMQSDKTPNGGVQGPAACGRSPGTKC